jgi:hypothetical protein
MPRRQRGQRQGTKTKRPRSGHFEAVSSFHFSGLSNLLDNSREKSRAVKRHCRNGVLAICCGVMMDASYFGAMINLLQVLIVREVAMTSVKVATFNLYHFAAPGIFWHARKPTATYLPAEWEAKKGWIASVAAEMNADVIGFQEVVSHEELKALMAANGYPYFFCTGHPMFDPDDPAVYVNGTVAIASRSSFRQRQAAVGRRRGAR